MPTVPTESYRATGDGVVTQSMLNDTQERTGSTGLPSMNGSSTNAAGKSGGLLLLVSKLAILIFAFVLTWKSGHRGIFFNDQSMVYDGAWRILQGQAPYRDFLMPFGPVMFWIQVVFFKFFGMSFSSMVLSAAVMNVIATASVMRMGRLLGFGSTYPALIGGIITAIWFQAPFGILWMEQVAFLFSCLALQCILEAGHRGEKSSVFWWVLAGCCVGCGVLTKQNAGGFFLPVCAGAIILQNIHLPKRLVAGLVWFGAGGLLIAFSFFVWLQVASDPAMFWHNNVEIARGIASRRLGIRPLVLIGGLFLCKLTPIAATPVNLLALLLGPVFLILGWLNSSRKAAEMRQVAVLGFVAMSLPLYQNLFAVSTGNEPENSQPFIGLILCLSMAGLAWLVRQLGLSGTNSGALRLPSKAGLLVGGSVILSSMAALLAAQGLQVDRTRIVQEFNHEARFTDRIKAPGLEGVFWGEPTRTAGDTIVRREDLESVVAYLQRKGGNFFVAGDATMLYGMLHKPSPQPLLYFCLNHSYTVRDIPRLDPIILRSLQAQNVQTMIRERITFLETQGEYEKFPQTWAWFKNEFQPVQQFGVYEVWDRKPSSQ